MIFKKKLAEELVIIREQINELKRQEKILREFFIEDMEKYNKKQKRYGHVIIIQFENERERIDIDQLHLNYPELYDKFLKTYIYTTLKCRRA